MKEYVATIGLEIHAELKTRTKMFCDSMNDPEETRPNTHICPVCMAHPGTLPVVNREAVRHVLRVGLALGGKLADYTEFDRKNYFYPDLPKGYQISQYEFPLVAGGSLNGVQITRVHLEEDTASSIHDDATGETLIDYNRAGVPLMELVTEPVIRSAEEAGAFGRELQTLLRYLGASDADMEKGQMRLEANISISDTDALGTKVEIKNINSFRAMERAVSYEIERQREVLSSGGSIVQETRGWDENSQSTFSQRVKEGSADYRYFPDPDIPSFKISEIAEFSSESLGKDMPELPAARKARYESYGIKPVDADLYVRDAALGLFMDGIVQLYGTNATDAIKLSSNYVANDLMNIIRELDNRDTEINREIPISPRNFKKIMDLVLAKRISSRSAKDILSAAAATGGDPEAIAKEKDLFQSTDTALLESTVAKIIADNNSVVEDYKAGKSAALEYLVGQCMKQLRGAADAKTLREIIQSKIG